MHNVAGARFNLVMALEHHRPEYGRGSGSGLARAWSALATQQHPARADHIDLSIGTAQTATNCNAASSSAAAAHCEAHGIIKPFSAAVAGLRGTIKSL
jgi:hypothetical protein